MSERLFTAREYGNGGAHEIVALVAGFGGTLAIIERAALELTGKESVNRRDVVAYEFSPDVLRGGDPQHLPTLVNSMHQDFDYRAMFYNKRRYAGVSLGAGIAWNMQRLSIASTQPGLYGAFCHDVVDLVLDNRAFSQVAKHMPNGVDIGEQFRSHGHDRESLTEAWAPLMEPHNGSFAVLLGKKDPVIPFEPMERRIGEWQEQGTAIKLLTRESGGHSRTMQYFLDHIVTEVLAQTLTMSQAA